MTSTNNRLEELFFEKLLLLALSLRCGRGTIVKKNVFMYATGLNVVVTLHTVFDASSFEIKAGI